MNLKDSKALITGSSSGIGAAIAKELARLGCDVAITWAHDSDSAENVRKECAALGVKTLVYQLDVRDNSQCERVVRDIADQWGGFNLLINSAGITKPTTLTDLKSVTHDDFLNLYSVNVVGVFQIVRAAAQFLQKEAISHVISISSMAGVNGRGSSIAYAASKGALLTMTKSLARVLGPNVRVNAVCPGLVNSRWTKKTLGSEKFEGQMRTAALRSTLKTVATPEDIAKAVVGLVQGSDLITGSTFYVDAGAHLGTAHLLDRDDV